MIFAKVDVKLRDHERAHRAGVAMATWTWALLYIREQETDGFVPDVALRGAWVGEKEALRHAAKLVALGLWEVSDGGWRICRYADKNETKETIAQRRAATKERVQKHRRNAVTDYEVTTGVHAFVPGSGSGSGSDLRSLGGAGGAEPSASATPPPWFVEAAKTADMGGAPSSPSDLPALWIRFQGSERWQQGKRSAQDAAAWLVPTIKGDRGKAARERRPAADTRQPLRDPNPEWLKTGGGDL